MTSTLTPKCHLEVEEDAEPLYSEPSSSSWTYSNEEQTQQHNQLETQASELLRNYLNSTLEGNTVADHFLQATSSDFEQNWQEIQANYFGTNSVQQTIDQQLMPPPLYPVTASASKRPANEPPEPLDQRTAAAILLRIRERVARQQPVAKVNPAAISVALLEQKVLSEQKIRASKIPEKISVVLHTQDTTDTAEYDIPSPFSPELTVGQYENLIQSFSMLSDIIDYISQEDRTKFTNSLKRSMVRQYERFMTPLTEGNKAKKVRKTEKHDS